MHENHWDDKGRDEKDIYAAPTLNRNQSETKQVGFWRRITPSSWVCRVLLATVITESLVDLAILVSWFVHSIGFELITRPTYYGDSITLSSRINRRN
jgi:hypothetical protein